MVGVGVGSGGWRELDPPREWDELDPVIFLIALESFRPTPFILVKRMNKNEREQLDSGYVSEMKMKLLPECCSSKCELCVYPCLIVKIFQCKIRGIIVIMKNYKSLFAKIFDLESNFKNMKGFLANVFVIITLAALLIFSPKFVVICYQKVFFLYKL